MRSGRRISGFTLLELLITVAIIAVLMIGVLFFLNPSEAIKSTHDGGRIADVGTLAKTIYLFESSVEGGSIGNASTVYVSVPDPAANSSAGNACDSLNLPLLPSGWAYHCAGPAYYKNADGSGWIPVNFAALPTGRPFNKLPADPANSTSTGFYYTYITNGGLNYELTSPMESVKYGHGGPNDVVSKDGGKHDDLYEVGSDTTLSPMNYALGRAGGGGSAESEYGFGGFESPIQADGSGIYNLGRTLPVKFGLTDKSGNPTTAPSAHLVIFRVQNGVIGTNPVILSTDTPDNGGLFRTAGSQYVYNLDTGNLTSGTWQLNAVLDDGSRYSVLISLDNI